MELGKALPCSPRCCIISWLFQKHEIRNMESQLFKWFLILRVSCFFNNHEMVQQRGAYIMELGKALPYIPRCYTISWSFQKHGIRNMESQLFKWFLILWILCFFNNHEMVQQRGVHIMELGKALPYTPRCCTISWLFQKHGISNMESQLFK